MTTEAPDDLLALRDQVIELCGFTDPNDVGIDGDPAHAARGGYHISGDDINAAGKFSSDYSTKRSRDHFLPNPYACAMDIGDDWPRGGRAAWLRFNNLLAPALVAGDGALATVRALNFSPDGTTKKRYDSANPSDGIITSTDDVNIHTHIEWWRNTREDRQESILRILQFIKQAIGGALVAETLEHVGTMVGTVGQRVQDIMTMTTDGVSTPDGKNHVVIALNNLTASVTVANQALAALQASVDALGGTGGSASGLTPQNITDIRQVVHDELTKLQLTVNP